MAVQKQAVVELVQRHRGRGRTVGEVLGSVGVARRLAQGGAILAVLLNDMFSR